jgi:hypothetical protein
MDDVEQRDVSILADHERPGILAQMLIRYIFIKGSVAEVF